MRTGRPAIGGPATGAADHEVEWTGIVDWEDYAQLEQRFEWLETPTTQDVVLAQEEARHKLRFETEYDNLMVEG